jgi:hypothetical protein
MEVVKRVESFIGMSWPFVVVDNDGMQGCCQSYFYNYIRTTAISRRVGATTKLNLTSVSQVKIEV